MIIDRRETILRQNVTLARGILEKMPARAGCGIFYQEQVWHFKIIKILLGLNLPRIGVLWTVPPHSLPAITEQRRNEVLVSVQVFSPN